MTTNSRFNPLVRHGYAAAGAAMVSALALGLAATVELDAHGAPVTRPVTQPTPNAEPAGNPAEKSKTESDAKGDTKTGTESTKKTSTKSDSVKPTDTPAKRLTKKTKTKLPKFFSRLSLDDEQIESIAALQDDFQKQIENLQKEIAAVEKQRDKAFTNVLSRQQRATLKEFTDAVEAKTRSKTTKAKMPDKEAARKSDRKSTKNT